MSYAKYSGLAGASGGGSSGANTSLSNLANPTAINRDLIAGSSGVFTALNLSTANQASGNSADINISTGTASGTRGMVSIDGLSLEMFSDAIEINPAIANDNVGSPTPFFGSISDNNSLNHRIIFGSSDTSISGNTTDHVFIQAGNVLGDAGQAPNAVFAGSLDIQAGGSFDSGNTVTGGGINIFAGTGGANGGNIAIIAGGITGGGAGVGGTVEIASADGPGGNGGIILGTNGGVLFSGSAVYQPDGLELTTGSILTPTKSFFVAGAGGIGAQTLDGTTPIAPGILDGQVLIVVNDGPNTIIFPSGGNVKTPAGASLSLTINSVAQFIYRSGTWYTVSVSLN